MTLPADTRIRVLFVCTANLCRSPTAEIAFRQLVPVALGVAGSRFDVVSAGTHARAGEPMDPESLRALNDQGLSGPQAAAFRSRLLTSAEIRAADLVLTATREHRRFVVQTAPEALATSFTLLEFARLNALVERASGLSDPVERFRASVSAARDRRGTIPPVPKESDDIVDPRGGTPTAYDEAFLTIYNALVQILGMPALKEPSSVAKASRKRRPWKLRRAAAPPNDRSGARGATPIVTETPTTPLELGSTPISMIRRKGQTAGLSGSGSIVPETSPEGG